jgi:hypothetical protein
VAWDQSTIRVAPVPLAGHRKDIMNRQKILIEHWRWLQVNGSKQQAASCKRQAASLTRKNYKVIGVYRRKKYESKRSN